MTTFNGTDDNIYKNKLMAKQRIEWIEANEMTTETMATMATTTTHRL